MGLLINPPTSLSKISYTYNHVDLYSGVVFIFFQKRVRVRVKNRVRVRVWFRLGLGLWLGFGNLIGGAASGVRLANRPGMAGIVLELTHGVPCPGRGYIVFCIVFVSHT